MPSTAARWSAAVRCRATIAGGPARWQRCRKLGVVEEAGDRRGERVDVAGRNEEARVAEHLGDAAVVGRDERQRRRSSLRAR